MAKLRKAIETLHVFGADVLRGVEIPDVSAKFDFEPIGVKVLNRVDATFATQYSLPEIWHLTTERGHHAATCDDKPFASCACSRVSQAKRFEPSR